MAGEPKKRATRPSRGSGSGGPWLRQMSACSAGEAMAMNFTTHETTVSSLKADLWCIRSSEPS